MELKELLAPLRKWWWLILISTMVAGAASFFVVRRQPPTYRTSVTLMVGRTIEDPNPSSNELFLTQQLARTYVDLVQRRQIREATEQALDLDSLPSFVAYPVPNTQLLEILVTDTDPERAQAVANELANQLILQSPSGLNEEEQLRQEFVTQQLQDLQADIEQTEDEIQRRRTELGTLFSASEIAKTESQIQALENKLNTLRANYSNLLANTQRGAVNTIHVVEPAYRPNRPIDPQHDVTILLAAAIGFILAAGAAYLLEYLDNTLSTPDKVRKVLDLPTLARVPVNKEQAAELIFMTHGRSRDAEAFRSLRTNFQFATLDCPSFVLLVTSALAGEGKSRTVANLAISLAQVGRSVIVVDADLHRPRQHRLFDVRQEIGLSTALLDADQEFREHLQETSVSGLRLLATGALPPNPAELLSTQRMRDLVTELRDEASIIILDSPPCLHLSDAATLATLADGVLLVVDASQTRPEVAKQALDRLRQVEAHLIGVLLNRVPLQQLGYYYYAEEVEEGIDEIEFPAEPSGDRGQAEIKDGAELLLALRSQNGVATLDDLAEPDSDEGLTLSPEEG